MKKNILLNAIAGNVCVDTRNWALAITALATGAVWLPAAAVAADIDGNQARNWGGFWIGFGAGYSENSYDGGLDRNFCITSANGSGAHEALSDCSASDGVVGVDAGAVTPGAAAAGAVDIAVDGSNSAVASGSGAILGANATASASAEADTGSASAQSHVEEDSGPSSADTSASQSVPGSSTAPATGSNFSSLSIAGVDTSGSPVQLDTTQQVQSSPHSARVVTAAFSDPSNGTLGAASAVRVGGPDGSAEALAIGLSGLPTNISGSEGGMAPNFNARYDHQTESNWVFGAELDLIATPNSGGALSSGTVVEISQNIVEVDRNVDVDTNLLASARLRFGYTMGDFLIYGTGGAAYTNLDATLTESGAFDGLSASRSQSESVNAFGGVIGGGVSAFVSDNAAVSLEGLYYRFNETIDFDNEGGDASVTLDDAFSVMMKFSIRTN